MGGRMSVETPKQAPPQINDLEAYKAAQIQIYKKWHNLLVNVQGLVVLSILCLCAPEIAAWVSQGNPDLAKYMESPRGWGFVLTLSAVNTLSYCYRLRNAIRRAESVR